MKRSQTFSCTLLLLVFSAAVLVRAAEESSSSADDSIVCICKCCYLGECTPLANASWAVSTCHACSASRCKEIIGSSSLRQKMARTFETLQDGVPEGARAGITVDVCEVISVLEAATCHSSACKRTTNLEAECFDRNEFLHKYVISLFVAISAIGVVFAFVKNHIPALQDFNRSYFNY